MNTVCYMHTIEYYSVIKNKVLTQKQFLSEENKHSGLYIM